MTDEEKKTPEESTEETTTEAPTEPVDVPEEEITGKSAEETPEEEPVDESQIEEIPYQDLRAGMVVRVHEKIKDVTAKGERERVQIFQGIILGVKGSGISRTMTVRKDSKGWMVEKIFPLSSPKIEKIEVVKRYRVRRAKLTYLKGRFKRKMQELKEEK